LRPPRCSRLASHAAEICESDDVEDLHINRPAEKQDSTNREPGVAVRYPFL
jgi:hypothetical protein